MKKTIGIYHNHICKIGGVETFLFNFCYNFKDIYDITIVYCTGAYPQLQRLEKIVKLKTYDSEDKFEFDIVIRNSVWGIVPDKLYSKENRYIEIRHANYKYLLDQGVLWEQYHPWERTNEVVACGEFVGKMSDLVLHDKPKVIRNILAPKKKTTKVLRFICLQRLDPGKGQDLIEEFCSRMRKAKVKFTIDIFSTTSFETEYEEIHFWKNRLEVFDYLVSSDYTLLLTKSEGLPYQVQESLQYKIPAVVTDVPGCTELIKDGINGYVLPLNLDYDYKKLLNIPKLGEYKTDSKEKWKEYLG